MLERRTRFWRRLAWSGVVAVALGAWIACGGGDSTGVLPIIQNINNSTDPASPLGLAIEINGSGFRSVPGLVRFAEGGNVADVAPQASGWSETGIIVSVPSAGDDGAFAVPGSVEVTVITSGGASNAVDLEIVTTPTFNVDNVQWSETTSLPTALRGLRAGTVPNTSSSAYVIVAGGNDGTINLRAVWTNTIAQDGTVGATWTETDSLPAARAHHGIAVAHPQNSTVDPTARYVYVIGGQASASDAPGGTRTVYVAPVSTADGSVGPWSETSLLPASVVGPAVAIYNGYLYVVGGLASDGTASSAVYSARVQSTGALGSWSVSSNAYPEGVAFAAAFGFGGNLYVLGGDVASSTDPNAQGSAGVKTARYAQVRNGAVGAWIATEQIVKQRKKHVAWAAFGQIIAAEGVYEGSPGSLELERSSIQADGTLAAWNGMTAMTQQIGANVYNAGAAVSPIRTANGGPRFLLLGGQSFVLVPPGALSDKVYYNTAP